MDDGLDRLSPQRAAVIREARSWIGTPYHHQGRVKGVGVDCGGLIIEVGRATGLLVIDAAEWKPFEGYGRAPNPARMERAMRQFLVRIPPSKRRPGDICWLAWRRDLPMHTAILARDRRGGRPTIIHALAEVGRVVEHGFTHEWPARAHSWWRYPGLV